MSAMLTLRLVAAFLCILEAGTISPPSIVARSPAFTALATPVRHRDSDMISQTKRSMRDLRRLFESFKQDRPRANGASAMASAQSFEQKIEQPSGASAQGPRLGIRGIDVGSSSGIATRHDCGQLTVLRDSGNDQNHHRDCSTTSSTTPLPTTSPLPSSTSSPQSPATTPAPTPTSPPDAPVQSTHEWGLIFLVPSSLFISFRLVRRLPFFGTRGSSAY